MKVTSWAFVQYVTTRTIQFVQYSGAERIGPKKTPHKSHQFKSAKRRIMHNMPAFSIGNNIMLNYIFEACLEIVSRKFPYQQIFNLYSRQWQLSNFVILEWQTGMGGQREYPQLQETCN